MKRLHVHLAVDELDTSVAFYRNLFGVGPTVLETDYAKWMLDDPRVNFAISARGRRAGLDHLGIQVDDDAQLEEVTTRLRDAERELVQEQAITCCYARGNKTWVADPGGVLWETFHTISGATVYGEDKAEVDALNGAAATGGACCAPQLAPAPRKAVSGSACCGPKLEPTPKADTGGSCC